MQLLLGVTGYLSNTFENNPLGKSVSSLDVSPQFQGYSGVEVVVDENTTCFAGNETGRVLTIENPWGTQTQADNILAAISGFQYQPYKAGGAVLNPAAELGDAVTVNGVYSGIYKMTRNFTPLMSADIEAPEDEEIDHEYPYESKQNRIYKREIADAQAQIRLNTNAITAEVTRATEAEGTLQSALNLTATEISAKVSKSGGSSSSFGWTLNDNSWTLTSGGGTVFKATADGVEVTGKITATSGFIGNGVNGFTITGSSIYNGMNSLYAGGNGIYIGTDGISLGGGNFRVTSGGSVSANNMTLTGTLNVGGATISAATLRSGAQSAYNNGSYWGAGAGYGYNYNNATRQGSGSYPGYFRANIVDASSSFRCQGYRTLWQTVTINGTSYTFLSRGAYTG